ncbi:MAG: hypothetical protein AB7T37_08160 [Dehalococcoidia bacterium]
MYSPTTFHLLAEDFRRERMESRRAFGSRPSRLGALIDRIGSRRAEQAYKAAQAPIQPVWRTSARD